MMIQLAGDLYPSGHQKGDVMSGVSPLSSTILSESPQYILREYA